MDTWVSVPTKSYRPRRYRSSQDKGEYECTYPHTTTIDPGGELTMVSVSSASGMCLGGDSEIEGLGRLEVDLNCVKEGRGKQL